MPWFGQELFERAEAKGAWTASKARRPPQFLPTLPLQGGLQPARSALAIVAAHAQPGS